MKIANSIWVLELVAGVCTLKESKLTKSLYFRSLNSLMLGFCLLFPYRVLALQKFESGLNQTNTIELFSSEGCSSCPPAEKWFGQLRDHSGLWKTFVPVEFHVDYWNQLGWIDPYSNQLFTQRQNTYAKQWGSKTVYTPGFVLNGREWTERKKSDLEKMGPKVGNLIITEKNDQKFEIEFKPSKKELERVIIYFALLANGLTSKVKAGENGGETLKHEFVALQLSSEETPLIGSKFKTLIDVKNLKRKANMRYSVVAWVSSLDSQVPIQAVGGDLN